MTTTHPDPAPSTHEGLASELLARRRKKLPALTAALALAVAAAAAFIGGAEAQKHWGNSTSAQTSGLPSGIPAFAAGAGGTGGFPATGGFAGAGTATSGTVTLIKGRTLYVTDATGNTILVHTTARSRVTKSASSTVKAVHPGDSVTVTGSRNNDGSYSASRLTIGSGNNG